MDARESIDSIDTALSALSDLRDLWLKAPRELYRDEARRLIGQLRATAAQYHDHETRPFKDLVSLAREIIVINDRLPEFDDARRVEDEDLYLSVSNRFKPARRDRAEHAVAHELAMCNILKRRAFRAGRQGELDAAADLMTEAADRAEEVASSQLARRGAAKHSSYLRFHANLFLMRADEGHGDTEMARVAWKEALRVSRDPNAPLGLFGGWVYDESDLDAYEGVILAEEAWRRRDYDTAMAEYDTWLNATLKHKGRWRRRNILVRRHAASVISCIQAGCEGCSTHNDARVELNKLMRDPYLGDAGRFIAQRAFSASEMASFIDPALLGAISEELGPMLPVDAWHEGSTLSLSAEEVTRGVPLYFTDLRSELKELASHDVPPTELIAHGETRLREFLTITLEYSQGRRRQPGEPALEHSDAGMSLSDIAGRGGQLQDDEDNQRFAAVRRAFKEIEGGLDDWARFADRYEQIVTDLAARFPAVVRVVARTSPHRVLVRTLTGDDIEISSQFTLEGDYAYFPSRFAINPPVSLTLKANDTWGWIPAGQAVDVFRLESMKLWRGDWSEIGTQFESIDLEVKSRLPKRKPIAAHVAAFANRNGGWLVFGIYGADSNPPPWKTIEGLTPMQASEVVDAIESACFELMDPTVVRGPMFRAYPDGNLTLLCRIYGSTLAPHSVNGQIYVRLGTQTLPVTAEEWSEIVGLDDATLS